MGGLTILYSNIAPKGAAIKSAGVAPGIQEFTGQAVCFDSHDDAVKGIDDGTVKKGDVVVIHYEGTKGGTGMSETLNPTANIIGRGNAPQPAWLYDLFARLLYQPRQKALTFEVGMQDFSLRQHRPSLTSRQPPQSHR